HRDSRYPPEDRGHAAGPPRRRASSRRGGEHRPCRDAGPGPLARGRVSRRPMPRGPDCRTRPRVVPLRIRGGKGGRAGGRCDRIRHEWLRIDGVRPCADRKSTRLNSSHVSISYAVFCLKKKKKYKKTHIYATSKV